MTISGVSGVKPALGLLTSNNASGSVVVDFKE